MAVSQRVLLFLAFGDGRIPAGVAGSHWSLGLRLAQHRGQQDQMVPLSHQLVVSAAHRQRCLAGRSGRRTILQGHIRRRDC